MRKVAVTTTKKSHATITLAWLWTKVSQRCLGSGVRTGPACKYFPTVRGDTRIPSLSFSSLAMRSSPQIGFSGHLPDPLPEVLGQTRSSRWFGLPAPKQPKSLALPSDQRVRLHIHQRIAPREHSA